MKFKINTKMLNDAVKKVSRVITNQATEPILIGILIEAKSDRLVFKGSNDDMELIDTVKADDKNGLKVAATGSLAVNSRVFKKVVNTLSSQTTTISTSPKFVMSIKSGRSNIHLNGLDADDYPHFGFKTTSRTALESVDSQVMHTIIKDTLSDTSTQQNRPVLTGVNLKPENGQLVANATDAHQLASVNTGIKTDKAPSDQVTILNKGLKVLDQLIGQNKKVDHVDLTYQSNLAYFRVGDYELYVRLLEGHYPDVSGLVPKNFKTEVDIQVANLMPALKQAAVIATTSAEPVININIKSDTQTVKLSTDSPEVGRSTTPIQADSVKGQDMYTNLNVNFLTNAVSKLDSQDTVKIQLISPLQPLLITDADDKARDFIQMITPIRIN